MKVKDLINIINIFDAKVIFDKPEEVGLEIMNGKSPLYFTPVEGEEKTKFENIENKKEFTSTTAAIHIIDVSVRELVNIFECDGSGIHTFTNNTIEPYCNEGIEKDIVYTIFLFLHEIGHWNQFKNMNNNVADFLDKDSELEKENFDKVSALKKQRQERMDKGNTCVLTAREQKLFEQYMHEYRNIPKEKEADEFALSKMHTVLEFYKNSCMLDS